MKTIYSFVLFIILFNIGCESHKFSLGPTDWKPQTKIVTYTAKVKVQIDEFTPCVYARLEYGYKVCFADLNGEIAISKCKMIGGEPSSTYYYDYMVYKDSLSHDVKSVTVPLKLGFNYPLYIVEFPND